MSVGIGDVTSAGQNLKNLGLVPEHSYSIIAASNVTDSSGNKLTLCQVRNPWGKGEWNGDWSDNSNKWKENPALAKELGHTVEDDGTFWMDYTDLKQFFTDI